MLWHPLLLARVPGERVARVAPTHVRCSVRPRVDGAPRARRRALAARRGAAHHRARRGGVSRASARTRAHTGMRVVQRRAGECERRCVPRGTQCAVRHRVAAALESGLVWVNCWLLRDLRVPFGGVKESGVGREGGRWSLEFFSEAKSVCVKAG